MLPMGWTSSDQISDLADPNAGPTKAERLREECTTYALVKKIRDIEPLHNVYTKLLYNVENSWLMYDPHNEFKRMGVPNSMWRISYANVQYELCDTYPAVLAFPKSVDDESLIAAAPFRSKQRLPTLSWRSTTNNATISRSSQPMVGLGLSRNSADEFLLREISRASLPASDDLTVSFGARSNPSVVDSSFTGLQMSEKSVSSINTIPLVQAAPRRYVITDARPLLNARANQAAGKGVESDKNYENCSVVFLDIGNIHAMRKSLEMMVEANCSDDANWLRNAEAAGWLGHVRKVLLGAAKIAHFLAYENLSVLVHCSDGWDRTSQLTSLSMLMMDGYYRTLRGFIVLIEKEWLSFGHKFADRQGWTSEGFVDEERSPIFAQFLDCVHQFLVQMPDAFEFNENLLLFLVTHLYSGWFGNFLFNSEYELKFHVSHKALLSIWTVVLGNKEYYKNPRYAARESPVVPVVSKSKLVIWHGWFLNWQDKIWNASWMETNQLDVKNEARVIDGKTCFKCEAVFTFTRRKHHCRCCAQIFCYDCCNARRIVPSVSTSYKSRCCNECALLLDMDYFNETETTRTKTQPTAYGNSNFRASLTQKPLLT
jgi:myotubularin-related protein 1/2